MLIHDVIHWCLTGLLLVNAPSSEDWANKGPLFSPASSWLSCLLLATMLDNAAHMLSLFAVRLKCIGTNTFKLPTTTFIELRCGLSEKKDDVYEELHPAATWHTQFHPQHCFIGLFLPSKKIQSCKNILYKKTSPPTWLMSICLTLILTLSVVYVWKMEVISYLVFMTRELFESNFNH